DYFVKVAVDLIAYNATPHGFDAVAEIYARSQKYCAWSVDSLLNHATTHLHPFGTAYDIVYRYPQFRGLVVTWVEEVTTRDQSTIRTLSQELLKREKGGRPITENDSILSALRPEKREIINQAVLTERLEENQRHKD